MENKSIKNKRCSSLYSISSISHLTCRAFTLIEMTIVLLIATLILGIAVNSLPKQRKIYTYQQCISELETAVRMAKLKAIEKGVDVSVCPADNSIVVYNKGADRTNPCNNTGNKLYAINFDSSIAVVKGSGFSFDPRGLGVIDGNICIQSADGNMHYKISVQSLSGRIYIEKGRGEC